MKNYIPKNSLFLREIWLHGNEITEEGNKSVYGTYVIAYGEIYEGECCDGS